MAEKFENRFHVIQNAYIDGNIVPSRWDVKKGETKPNPEEVNTYEFKLDPDLEPDESLAVFNTNVFKAIFGKGDEGKITKTGEATLIVHYPARWFGLFDHEAKRRFPVSVVRKNADKTYPDAPKFDTSWLGTMGFSEQLMKRLVDPKLGGSKYVEGDRIKVAISTKKASFWLGFTWSHPRQDINLGFIWAQISLVLSVLFYIIGLFGEAYGWAGGLKHFLDHLGK